jgi:hypothetical protein
VEPLLVNNSHPRRLGDQALLGAADLVAGETTPLQRFIASRVSHDPCLQNSSLRFAHSRRMRPLFVGRPENVFIQRHNDPTCLTALAGANPTLGTLSISRSGSWNRS